MQEVAVEHRHIGYLAKLDGTQTMLLTELTGYVDSHGTQRLLAGDGFLGIAARVSWHDELRITTLFCRVNAELDIHHRGNGIVGVEYHVCTCIIE